MDKHVTYKTHGVCAQSISFDLIDGRVWNIQFDGGCRGNTTGVAALADGMKAEDVIRRCAGIDCHAGNSCPNELAKALKEALGE